MRKDFIIILLLLIYNIQSQLTHKEREILLKKYTKIINKNHKNHITPLKELYFDDSEITYQPSKIQEIIKKYNFPQSYNFIEETNANVTIKDQENCGSCWAFASTTALAYRYHKRGIEVDLSPQNLISCTFGNCDSGDYLINTQFFLVKNGTITEECLPYSSADGKTIEKCPSKCKNGEEYKKYYAKNAYSTQLDYDKDNYYDIVTIIMDQLINYGPVVAGINVYDDFRDLDGPEKCYNEIYKYDGESEFAGGHTVVIVGYGYEKSKYYWLIQNSWGTSFCKDGFAKIEFGEICIENVGFSEPYIPEEDDDSSNNAISTKLTLNGDCRLNYNIVSDNNDKSFEVRFRSVKDSDSEIYYQCNSDSTKNKAQGICNYDFNIFFQSTGYYQYYNSNSLNNNNTFNLDISSIGNQFYYYGSDFIGSIYDNNYYVSEKGSEVLLLYSPNTDEKTIYNIYINKYSSTALSDCKLIDVEIEDNYYLIYCKLKSSEINLFGNNNNLPLSYDILCGYRETMDAIVHKLDKSKYPVFRVKYLVLPQEERIGMDSEFYMLANVEGSTSGGNKDYNIFISLINIRRNNHDYIDYLYCVIINPVTIENNFLIIYCYLSGESLNNRYTTYNNIYLTNYYYPVNVTSPFEIIIEKNISGISYNDYINDPSAFRTNSKFIKASFLFILSLLVLL